MSLFVLELGTEELPARFLADAENELKLKFSEVLTESKINYENIETFSTPRRLVVKIEGLPEKSDVYTETITGPSVKVAYDVGGRPTRAAEGFAKGHNISLEDVFTQETDKGTYIAVTKTLGGELTVDVLSRVCSSIILGLHFPKKMRWSTGSISFARPIRWILALFDDSIVNFSVADYQSSNITFGHRVYSGDAFEVDSAKNYVKLVQEVGKIVLSSLDRLSIIKEQGHELAMSKQGEVLWNEDLLNEVKGLCEFPVPMLGNFDNKFLSIPKEVLLTSMEHHQKSFGVEKDGKLLPYFITVLNCLPEDDSLIKKGWERVLRARLEDANFFWDTDNKSSFGAWLEKLNSVVFLAQLGSMKEKALRLQNLCGWLANNIKFHDYENNLDASLAKRSGYLAKADLVSSMVNEFPTLQGIMGGIYAKKFGEDDVVANAIKEQYLPLGPDSHIPSSDYGALVAISDKADTLVGCFGLNIIPSGAADQYALRRAALGIIRILEEKKIKLNVMSLFKEALSNYGQIKWKMPENQILGKLEEFFMLRLKNHFTGKGFDTLHVDSVLKSGFENIYSIRAKIEALSAYSSTHGYESLVFCYKRIVTIIQKQSQELADSFDINYDKNLFLEPAEKALADSFEDLMPKFNSLFEDEQYTAMYMLVDGFTPSVSAFFDDVMVVCDDLATRTNRLRLLNAVGKCIGKLADFTALQL